MKKKLHVAALALAAAVVFTAAGARAQEGAVSLKLGDAIRMAVENNLDVKVELYNPAMAQADIMSAMGIYDPLLSLAVNYNRNTVQTGPTFTPLRINTVQVDAGVSQLLTSGGTASVTANNAWNSNSFDYYQSNLNFSVNQPLLRNFGRENTDYQITVARYSKEGTLDNFKRRLSDVITQVRIDYFTLYSLRQNLEVQRTSLRVAQRLLSDTRGRVAAGVLPAMEILSAEAAVATAEKNITDAEKALRDQMDVLRLELQLPGTADIVPVDAPTRDRYKVSENDATVRALAERPELAAQRVTITTNDLQARIMKNRTLPDLNLTANVGFGGYDSSFSGTLDRTVTGQYPVWGIGLNFTYPLGNDTARNNYIRAKLQLEQSQTQLRNLEASVTNQVRTAIRALDVGYRQIEATTRLTAYDQDVLTAFQKKNAVGLATTKEVFDVLQRLITDQGTQIQAIVTYNNAISQLWRATGEILDRHGIRVDESQADQLYNRNR